MTAIKTKLCYVICSVLTVIIVILLIILRHVVASVIIDILKSPIFSSVVTSLLAIFIWEWIRQPKLGIKVIKKGDPPQGFLVPFTQVIDIHPKSSGSFCVVVKDKNKGEWYGFSSWSNIYGLKKYKLNNDKCIVEVEITSSGKKWHEKFHLENPSTKVENVKIMKYDANKKIYQRLVERAVLNIGKT